MAADDTKSFFKALMVVRISRLSMLGSVPLSLFIVESAPLLTEGLPKDIQGMGLIPAAESSPTGCRRSSRITSGQ
jgi:hypothetical protein